MTLEDHLDSLDACPEAREWARDYPTLHAAWAACERVDWLLWYAARRGIDRKLLVRAACACARTALPHVLAGDDRPRHAIELAERWANGDPDVTRKDLRYAADAADAAAYAAAYAAADAAYAADAAAYAADADAADAAANAAANAGAAAHLQAHRTLCGIVRSLIPCPEEP